MKTRSRVYRYLAVFAFVAIAVIAHSNAMGQSAESQTFPPAPFGLQSNVADQAEPINQVASSNSQILQPLVPAIEVNRQNKDNSATVDSTRNHWMDQTADGSAEYEPLETIKRITVSFFGVMAVCVIALLILKRSGWAVKPDRKTRQSKSHVCVLETIKVGNRSYLKLIEADGARFVVGFDPTGIKSIVQTKSSFGLELQSASDVEAAKQTIADSMTDEIQGKTDWHMPATRYVFGRNDQQVC